MKRFLLFMSLAALALVSCSKIPSGGDEPVGEMDSTLVYTASMPKHVFGFIGTLMFFFGFLACIVVGGTKIIALYNHTPAPLVTDSPYFYIALTMMILGTQLFLAGFLGELIIRNSSERNNYLIKEEF